MSQDAREPAMSEVDNAGDRAVEAVNEPSPYELSDEERALRMDQDSPAWAKYDLESLVKIEVLLANWYATDLARLHALRRVIAAR